MPANEDKVDKIISIFNELRANRAVWEDHWQTVGEYVHGVKQEFTQKHTRGERLNYERHTPEAVFANRKLASALIGMLWPNGAQSIKLIPSGAISDSQQNKDYLDQATEIMIQAMDDPLAGLVTALDEYMLDQGAFGTSGMGIFEGRDSLLHFEAWGTEQLYISEGNQGRVETEFKHFTWPLPRVVDTFGIDNVSEKVRDLFKTNRGVTERVELLHAIMRRIDRDPNKDGSLNMPYMSAFLERENKHLIRESGFQENPVKVARFRKLTTEEYGRSPGTDGLSNVLELDYLTERLTVNVDKSNDPPLLMTSDGRLGGGIIDTSAGALNIIDISGRQSNNIDPVSPLFSVGDPSPMVQRMEQLNAAISQHFFIDQLLDFNNQTQMTASETLIRDRIRAAALGSIFNRQIAELFDPMISRVFNLLLSKNQLGVINGSPEHQQAEALGQQVLVIPNEIAQKMAQGQDVFKIKYFTPAARMLQIQRAEALQQLTIYTQGLMQTDPTAGDSFNSDKAVKLAAEIGGLGDILRSDDEVKQLREQRAQAQQAQALPEQLQMGSQTAKNLAQAEAA